MDYSKLSAPGPAPSARAHDNPGTAAAPRLKLPPAETPVTREVIYAHALLLVAF